MGFVHDWTGSYTLAFGFAIAGSMLSAFAIWRAAPSRVRLVAGRVRAARACLDPNVELAGIGVADARPDAPAHRQGNPRPPA
jgi:hypothetical protein